MKPERGPATIKARNPGSGGVTEAERCPLCSAGAEVSRHEQRAALVVRCHTCATYTIDVGVVEYFTQTRRAAKTILALARLSECTVEAFRRGYQLDIRSNNWEALAMRHKLDDELRLDDIE